MLSRNKTLSRRAEPVQIAFNFTSYSEVFSNLFMGFASHCPRYAEYEVLYPNSVRLQTALCNFHASLIRCCKHAVEVAKRDCLSALMLSDLTQSLPSLTEPRENTAAECCLALT